MSKTTHSVAARRREFLKLAAVASGAAAVAGIAGGATAEVPEADESATGGSQSQGYHLTPHIKAYYEKARF